MKRAKKLLGRYSENDAISVEGDKLAYKRLIKSLESFNRQVVFNLHIPKVSPSPYENYLTIIKITYNGNLLLIQRNNSILQISGSKTHVDNLIANIKVLIDYDFNSAGNPYLHPHLHIEYLGDDFGFLSSSSLPLILVLRNDL